MAKKGTNKGGAANAPAVNPLAALMAQAVQARQNNTAMYSTKQIMAGLISHANGQLVEYNEQATDGAGNIAFRATEVGMNVYASGAFGVPAAMPSAPAFGATQPTFGQQQPATQQSQQPAKVFTFRKGIPIPPARRGAKGNNAYGFEQMDVGDSFDIPATQDNPNPAKRVASTVSSASKRLAPKQFIVRGVTENNVTLARVWRSA